MIYSDEIVLNLTTQGTIPCEGRRSRRARWSVPGALVIALSALFATVISSTACHAQSPYAPGGLFIHPTAYTPRAREFSIYAAGFTEEEAPGMTGYFYPLALTYAPTNRLQVSGSAVYHQDNDTPSHTHFGGFLKYQLTPDTLTHPAIAIAGGYFGHDHLESTVSGIVSHSFTVRKRIVATLHTGVKWGATPHDQGGYSDVGGFVGAQLPLSREWNLVGETSTRFNFDIAAASSIGVMYHNRSGADVSIGFVNGGRSRGMKFFFGVGLPLGH